MAWMRPHYSQVLNSHMYIRILLNLNNQQIDQNEPPFLLLVHRFTEVKYLLRFTVCLSYKSRVALLAHLLILQRLIYWVFIEKRKYYIVQAVPLRCVHSTIA